MIIKLIKHGESQTIGDIKEEDKVILTNLGWEQATEAGKVIGSSFLGGALIYTSPYIIAKQTLSGIISGSNIKLDHLTTKPMIIYEDQQLRELEFGYQKTQENIKRQMFYRYAGGESVADCFSRVSLFIDNMMRQASRKLRTKILIVSHGITIRCFVARFMRLTVAQYDQILNPLNGDIITISEKSIIDPVFQKGRWVVMGLKLRQR